MGRLRDIKTMLGWQFAPARMIEASHPKADPALDDVYMKRGLILIHIPKNAGTSVEDALFDYRVRHRTWQEIRDSCPMAWAALPKLAILRDPVDRFLSAYDFLNSGGRNEMDRSFGARMIGQKPIEIFLEQFSSNNRFRNTTMGYFHFRRQSDFICDGEDVMVDHLIPFHLMAEGLVRIAGIRPQDLAHSNKTTGKRTQRSDLPQASIDQINRFYAADVALFAKACDVWDTVDGLHTRDRGALG